MAPGPKDARVLSAAPSPALSLTLFHQPTRLLGVMRAAHYSWDVEYCSGLSKAARGTVVTQSTEGTPPRYDLVGRQLHLPRHQSLMPSTPGLLLPPTQPGEIAQLC